MQKLTPMMQQYWNIKQQYTDCILFFRLGDFYEMFFDDALLASNALNLTLTSRDCGFGNKAPMCGIPFHASESYIPKLIEKGFKIAICEQMANPEDANLMTRDVVRIITAGTILDETMLDGNRNNFIASVYSDANGAGIAWSDLTTGEFYATEINNISYDKFLQDNLVRVNPAEIICNNYYLQKSESLPCVIHCFVPKFNAFKKYTYDFEAAKNAISSQLKIQNTDNLMLFSHKHAVIASGALMEYFELTQRLLATHITSVKYIADTKFMSLDTSTRKNLELTSTLSDNKKKGSLLGVLSETKTSMGARCLTSWIEQPLQDKYEINMRLDGIQELWGNQMLCADIEEGLSQIRDVERLTGKIAYGSITPRDCYNLAKSIHSIITVKHLLKDCKSEFIANVFNDINEIDKVYSLLDKAILKDAPIITREGGFIKEGFNAELDRYNGIKANGKSALAELENKTRQETEIKNLRLGFNRVFGYFYDVTKSYQHLVPSDWERKQTLANAERYINSELKELEDSILNAEDRAINLEINLFNQIKETLKEYMIYIQLSARAIANLDCVFSLATVAKKYKYTRPNMLDKGEELCIKDGRHPVVEALLKDSEFVPNDTVLNNGEDNILIITGPNMAGKSTYMRQTALIVLLAHIGSFVPASVANIPITDAIWTRVGANDNLAFAQSTFMVEMTEVANILANATKDSLIILDEIGRGTSTYDGLSIAWAIIEYLRKNIKAKTLFSTHYHELTELEGKLSGVKNFRVTIKEYNDTIIFLHKIIRGGASRSFGIEVAKLAGLPSDVIDNAKQLLLKLNKSDINNQNLQANKQQEKVVNSNINEVVNELKELDINTLSPLEAMNVLFKLKNKVVKL